MVEMDDTMVDVAVIDDASLSPGGCRIFTTRGRIDADLDGQLDRIVADLMPTTAESTDATSPDAGGA